MTSTIDNDCLVSNNGNETEANKDTIPGLTDESSEKMEVDIGSDDSFVFDLDDDEIIKALIKDHEQFGPTRLTGAALNQTISATIEDITPSSIIGEIQEPLPKRDISALSEPDYKFTSKYIKPDPQTGILPLSLAPRLLNSDIEDLPSSLGGDTATTDRSASAPMSVSQATLPIDTPFKVFRDGRLSVTDMTTKYCEVQSFYALCGLERVQSAQVNIGTEYHNQLEMAVEGIGEQIEVPEVLIRCEEDARWIYFQGMYVMLRALMTNGATRELYVFAKLRGTLVTGIIDDLQIVDSQGKLVEPYILDHIKGWLTDKESFYERESTSGDFFGNWYVKLADTKTRGRDTLPIKSQQLSAFHQLLLYHRLFSDLTDHAATSFTVLLDILANDFRLDLDVEVNPLILDLIYGSGDQMDYSHLNSIRKIMENYILPAMSIFKDKAYDRLDVEYVYTTGPNTKGKPISTVSYQYSATELEKILDYRFGFWHGMREPEGANISEVNYKCPNCPFIDHCGWRAKKAEEAIQRAKKRRTGTV